jgi:hypothetical protein
MTEAEGWKRVSNHTEVELVRRVSADDRSARSFPEVERSEVSGLPVFWADAPGPFVAGIVFRVGRADERPPEAGITHLVEHLALPGAQQKTIEFNGSVASSTTWFWFSGEQSAALELLRTAAASISRLPARLETERGILLAEASARGNSAAGLAAALCFGPSGHGLVGYPEFGLCWLGQDRVSSWAQQRFTTGNAALWMTGEPPADLGFSLPAGERRPAPAPAPLANVTFPCVYPHAAPGGATIAMLMRRSVAASMAASVALEPPPLPVEEQASEIERS